MLKTPTPTSSRTFPMTDARGRHLPFDRAAVGVGMYWYSLPDGEATVIGEIVLLDSYNLLGAGPFAGYAYERHPVGRVRAINDTVDLLLQVILRGKSATFPAHKVMPPARLFARRRAHDGRPWGRHPERATPDATPLPVTLVDAKRGGAHPPPH